MTKKMNENVICGHRCGGAFLRIDIGTGLSNLRMTKYRGADFPEKLIEYAEEYNFAEGHSPLYVDAGQQSDYLYNMTFEPVWDDG